MNRKEYKEYQEAVKEFMEEEGINNLSRAAVTSKWLDNPSGNNTIPMELSEPEFSSKTCDCCNTHLAGDRIQANGWNPKEKRIQEYTICLDCEYYAEYGQLDDMTMLDIEKSD